VNRKLIATQTLRKFKKKLQIIIFQKLEKHALNDIFVFLIGLYDRFFYMIPETCAVLELIPRQL